MAAPSKIGYLLGRLAQGVAAHDRENPGHHTWGIGMAHFDIERLGLEEGEEILPGIVLQADGGTRTAAITGAYVALADAIGWLGERGKLATPDAIVNSVAAVSVGVIDGEPRLDLAYEEDVRAGTDMNVVCTGTGGFVEVQGTAEGAVFDRPTLDALLDLAVAGCAELTGIQERALAGER